MKTYFMNKGMYQLVDGSEVTKEPFNILTPDQWLTVFHRNYSHEVKTIPRKQRVLANRLSMGSDLFLTYSIIRYVKNRIEKASLWHGETIIDIPAEEKDVFRKATKILSEFTNHYLVDEWNEEFPSFHIEKMYQD